MKKLLLYFFIFSGLIASAQKADQLAQNYLDAIGGKKLDQVKSISQKGTMSMNGVDFPMEAYQNINGQMYSKINMMGSDIVAAAFDGQKGYVFDNATFGYKDIPDSLTDAFRQKAKNIFGYFYQYKKNGTTLKYVGQDTFKGKTVEVVEMHLATPGQEGIQDLTVYFDPETHYIAAIKVEKDGHKVLTIPAKYKGFDGVYFPMEMQTEIDGTPMMTIKFEEIKINPPAPDPAIFTKPKQ